MQFAVEHQPVLRIMLRDSSTGEKVLLLRDITRGSEFAEAIQERGDAGARELLSEWARLLRDRLDEARRTNAPSPPTQPSSIGTDCSKVAVETSEKSVCPATCDAETHGMSPGRRMPCAAGCIQG